MGPFHLFFRSLDLKLVAPQVKHHVDFKKRFVSSSRRNTRHRQAQPGSQYRGGARAEQIRQGWPADSAQIATQYAGKICDMAPPAPCYQDGKTTAEEAAHALINGADMYVNIHTTKSFAANGNNALGLSRGQLIPGIHRSPAQKGRQKNTRMICQVAVCPSLSPESSLHLSSLELTLQSENTFMKKIRYRVACIHKKGIRLRSFNINSGQK